MVPDVVRVAIGLFHSRDDIAFVAIVPICRSHASVNAKPPELKSHARFDRKSFFGSIHWQVTQV